MAEASAILESLVHELETCAQCYGVLLEWKQLHDYLQQLEGPISLIDARVRVGDIKSHWPEIKKAWQLCRDIISYKLVPFAKEIEHIGKQYEEKDGQRSGEEWIVKIVQAQEDISEDLKWLRLVPLRNHIGDLDSLITNHLFRAGIKLQTKHIALDNSCEELSSILTVIVDEFLEEELVRELKQFVKLQKRLVESMELHELYQKLRTNYIMIYKFVRQKRPEELEEFLDLIRIQWEVFKNTVLWQLVTFAEGILYIGKAYQAQEQALFGEGWVVKLVKLGKAIDQALEDGSLVSLHKSVNDLGDLIGGYFIQVDKELQKYVGESSAFSTGLRGRIGL